MAIAINITNSWSLWKINLEDIDKPNFKEENSSKFKHLA
jgi:hypothetical protein